MAIVFKDLPLDLLPLILDHLVRPAHIAKACLVNKDFCAFSVQKLYHRVFIYAWHVNVKTRFIMLFKTLASCPDLARFVEELSAFHRSMDVLRRIQVSAAIRDFPRALLLGERNKVLQICLQGIQNCINLRSCTWTRDGSLSDDVLQTLGQLSLLTCLEINGNNVWQYNPRTLFKFNQLRKLSLIMPGAPVVEVLPQWLNKTGPTLQRLTLICQSSPRINDELLADIAPHLSNLESLHLLGCSKITHKGLWKVVSSNPRGLLSLGAESLSTAFNMAEFSVQCMNLNALNRLKSITLTVNLATDLPSWGNSVLDMLSSSTTLERFHISTSGGDVRRELPAAFVEKFVDIHAFRLRRFSVQRMHVDLVSIQDVCQRCPRLEELFVVVDFDEVDDLGPCLASTRRLRSLHINRPIEASLDELPTVRTEKILALVKQSGSELRQIGFGTRVWQVQYEIRSIPGSNGDLEAEPVLAPYEHPELPEQFLVVRA